MERDARYATVALFTLACIVAALAFVWWYSGRGDRRDFDTYEIYFEGTVSGLSKGSPVRYLGVDVGRADGARQVRAGVGRQRVHLRPRRLQRAPHHPVGLDRQLALRRRQRLKAAEQPVERAHRHRAAIEPVLIGRRLAV